METMTQVVSAAANGTTAAWENPDVGYVCVTGEFDGATVTLQASVDGGTTWADVGDAGEFIAAGWCLLNLPTRVAVHAVIAGGGGSEAIDIYAN